MPILQMVNGNFGTGHSTSREQVEPSAADLCPCCHIVQRILGQEVVEIEVANVHIGLISLALGIVLSFHMPAPFSLPQTQVAAILLIVNVRVALHFHAWQLECRSEPKETTDSTQVVSDYIKLNIGSQAVHIQHIGDTARHFSFCYGDGCQSAFIDCETIHIATHTSLECHRRSFRNNLLYFLW